MFFNELHRFGENIALIDCDIGQSITYFELDQQSNDIAEALGFEKELVFIEAKNSIESVVTYLGALKANKIVYLLDKIKDPKVQSLIDLYQPNIVVSEEHGIERKHAFAEQHHEELALLLSTSGSTGTPKFVKLSQKNIQSNALSIAEYLQLTSADIAMSHLKLHYSYGISILHSHLVIGATTAFTSYGVLDGGFWENIDRFSATSFAGVPYTFEALAQKKFDFTPYQSLRYITQAGGKLEGALVELYASMMAKQGVDFYVMYGQTEAAPRISYLPPELASKYPTSIGRAIPGGTLTIIDEKGDEITEENIPGELAYQGDNVMMGYAESKADLSLDETPKTLLTGDIACKTTDGLFYIVGRTKRFVKLFGLRMNLDDVQSFVKTLYPQSAVTGDDHHIVIAVEANNNADENQLVTALSEKYGLPQDKFKMTVFDSLPLLTSGKYDYKSMMVDQTPKMGFVAGFIHKVSDILGLNYEEWASIHDLFSSVLQLKTVDETAFFNNLETDSLSFVQLSIELEHCLGDDLPTHWQDCTIMDLDSLYQKNKLA